MAETTPCDLHVLSMPPAFTLSQDQTLRFIISPNPRPKAQIQTYHKQSCSHPTMIPFTDLLMNFNVLCFQRYDAA
jgi:hypothetical protein